MSNTHLVGPYSVAVVSSDEWEAFFSANVATVFPDEASLPFDSLFSDEEKAKLDRLKERVSGRLELYFLIYDGEKPVGWHFGFQRSELEYFMANTGILPGYQRRGIYSAFLKYAIGRILDEGFQFITSIHHLDNNAVLIPKLKAGFMIQSTGFLIQTMILESNYGTMIQLVYPAKEIYRKTLSSQIGTKAMNEELRKLMAL